VKSLIGTAIAELNQPLWYLSVVEFSKIIIIEVSWNSYWPIIPSTVPFVTRVVSATSKISRQCMAIPKAV